MESEHMKDPFNQKRPLGRPRVDNPVKARYMSCPVRSIPEDWERLKKVSKLKGVSMRKFILTAISDAENGLGECKDD